MKLSLLVVRSPDPKLLSEFYELLGFTFEYHKHGNSPYHYSTDINGTILEIYPLKKEQAEADKYLRLGFVIPDFDQRIALLKEKGIPFVSEPANTDFGYCAVVNDHDGRSIELYNS